MSAYLLENGIICLFYYPLENGIAMDHVLHCIATFVNKHVLKPVQSHVVLNNIFETKMLCSVISLYLVYGKRNLAYL